MICHAPANLRFHSLSSRRELWSCNAQGRSDACTTHPPIDGRRIPRPRRFVSGSGLAVVTATLPPNREDDPNEFSCQTY
jgi:hypothetical protein